MKRNIQCNACARKIKEENGMLREDIFEGKKEWGYFSRNDLKVDTFYLCEDCYDKLITNFLIPIKREDKLEVL